MTIADALRSEFKNKLKIMNGGEVPKLKRVPTYVAGMDIVMGGGLPKGRIIELCGKFSSGKTAVSLAIAAQIIKQGGKALFIDNEHSIDEGTIIRHGLHEVGDSFLYTDSSSSGEMDLDLCMAGAREGIDLVIVDCAANLLPEAVVEKLNDDPQASGGYAATMGVAQLISRFRRNLPAVFSSTGSTLILINQIRVNTGTVFASHYSPGGKALEHITSIKIEMSGSPDPKKAGTSNTKLKGKKNKTARPFLTSDLRFIDGVPDIYYSLITEGRRLGVLKGTALTYEIPQELKEKHGVTKNLGSGIDKACLMLEHDMPWGLFEDLYGMVMKLSCNVEQDLSLAEDDAI